MEMEGCLICGGPQQPPTKSLPPFPSFLLSGENSVIKEHLWTIFILRRLLQLPKETCEQLLLRTFGLNPGGWFALCETCSEVGHNAARIFCQILELEKELEGLREETKGRLRRSMEGEKQRISSNRDVFCVREEIRGYFWKTLQPRPTRKATTTVYKLEEDDLGDDDDGGNYCVSEGELSDYNPDHSDDIDSSDNDDKEEEEQASSMTPPKRKRRKRGSSGTTRTSRPGRPKRGKRVPPKSTVGGDKYKCDKCDFVAQYAHEYKKHLYQHKTKDHIVQIGASPKRFQCTICKHESPQRNEAVQHLRDNHGEQLGIQIFRCTSCEHLFDSRTNLRFHIKTVHMGQKPFCCDICGAGYAMLADFEDHKAKHANGGRSLLICEACGMEMSNRRTLLRHIKKFHPASDEGGGGGSSQVQSLSVKCPQCDIKVLHSTALKQHLKAAHGDLYKFGCDLCDATYIQAANLQIHKAAAHAAKVKCPHCQKLIGCEKYLAQHWIRFCKAYPGKK